MWRDGDALLALYMSVALVDGEDEACVVVGAECRRARRVQWGPSLPPGNQFADLGPGPGFRWITGLVRRCIPSLVTCSDVPPLPSRARRRLCPLRRHQGLARGRLQVSGNTQKHSPTRNITVPVTSAVRPLIPANPWLRTDRSNCSHTLSLMFAPSTGCLQWHPGITTPSLSFFAYRRAASRGMGHMLTATVGRDHVNCP